MTRTLLAAISTALSAVYSSVVITAPSVAGAIGLAYIAAMIAVHLAWRTRYDR